MLRFYGHTQAARTLAGAAADRGDISGIPNTVIQAKRWKEYAFGPWLNEAKEQADNAGVTQYIVVAKRRGIGDPAESFAVMPLWLAAQLLHE